MFQIIAKLNRITGPLKSWELISPYSFKIPPTISSCLLALFLLFFLFLIFAVLEKQILLIFVVVFFFFFSLLNLMKFIQMMFRKRIFLKKIYSLSECNNCESMFGRKVFVRDIVYYFFGHEKQG